MGSGLYRSKALFRVKSYFRETRYCMHNTNILLYTERPALPTMSCGPQPYVLENTNITCTCSTTSLGEPAGYLTWDTGNQENQERAFVKDKQISTQKVINFTQILTLSDHGATLLRCDFIWGPYRMNGETYTAQVGCKLKNIYLWVCVITLLDVIELYGVSPLPILLLPISTYSSIRVCVCVRAFLSPLLHYHVYSYLCRISCTF